MFAIVTATLALLAAMPASADPGFRAAAEAPVSAESIPLVFDDPVFSGVADSSFVILRNGESLVGKSITVKGPAASILCHGTCVIDRVRVSSREAVRIADRGTFSISNSYLEATGIGSDHADVIQAYSPGDCGTIHISNTSIVAHNTAATAGMFVSDNWTGSISLNNVVFNGGPYGLRLKSGIGGDNVIAAKDVYFVGPFMYKPVLLQDMDGHRNIVTQWENVRHATIVDGKLVPGRRIPCPALRCGAASAQPALAALEAQAARGCSTPKKER
jgi:hypothetical protein